MKTSTRLNEIDRKYIVAALRMFDARHDLSIFEKMIISGLIKKINSGIRYDKQNAQSLGKK